MRYPASEKLEIIRLVEQSYLPIKQTLDKLGIVPLVGCAREGYAEDVKGQISATAKQRVSRC